MKSKWEYKTLGDVCDSLNGLWTGKKEPFVNVAVIRNTNFSKDCKLKLDDVAYLDVEQKQYLTRKLIPGDIIVEKSGGSDKQPVGRVVLFDIPDGEYSFSNFTGTLRIKNPKELNSRYLYRCLVAHYLRGETRKLQSKTTGLHNLDMKGYLKLPIPVPPLDEQQRIVAELDLLTEVIDKRRMQLKELDTLAQSIFYDMFGDPIENEKGWGVKRLGEACDVRDGTHDSPKYVENGYPLVTSKNVVEGTISFQDVNYICQEDYDAISKRSRVDDGDIIMPMIGTIGKPVVVKKDREFAIKNVALIKFLPETSVLNVFVLALMSSSAFNTYMLSKNKGGTQKFIALGDIRKLMIPIPPLTLQQEFADKIQSIEKQKAAVNQSIAETQKLLDYTMDKYFG